MIYFDNNANVPMRDEILNAYKIGISYGNISNHSKGAEVGMFMKNELTRYLKSSFPGMNVYYTSGGSESNSTIISNFKNSHIVCSSVEHWSIIAALEGHEVSWLKPRPTGHINPDGLLGLTNNRTGLIIMQSVNSETGAKQDLMKLIVNNSSRIPIHCDHVQGFMKTDSMIGISKYCERVKQPISFAISFHKIGAPIGFGAIITNMNFSPLVHGKQNDGKRGGTYNAPAICATLKAINMYNYNKIYELREVFDREIKKHFIVINYADLMNALQSGAKINSSGYIVMFSCQGCLPHTIFFAICERNNTILCGSVVREMLAKKDIVIGIGSACNDVKETMGSMRSSEIPEELKNGFIRISLSCYNTQSEIKKLVKALSNYD